MPIPFEFVIAGPPISQQTRRRELVRRWTEQVKNAAQEVWDANPPVAGPLMVTITYFFDDPRMDVDSIPKPILDGLKGIVFEDDSEVFDLLCCKRDLNDDLRIDNPPLGLVEYLDQSRPALHISVTEALTQEVDFVGRSN